MTSVTIHIPDDMARSLQGIAASRHQTLEELAVDGVGSLVEKMVVPEHSSAAAILRGLRELPHVLGEDVDALEAAIKSGRVPAQDLDIFRD